MLLNNFLNVGVVEGGWELSDRPFTFEEFTELVLDKQQNLTNLSVGIFGSQNTLSRSFRWSGVAHLIFGLVLFNVLGHDLIVKAKSVSISQVVV